MKKYDKYKPTGSPWIGDVPEHWEVKRFRFVCNYKKGKNPKNLVFDFEDGMKPYLSMDYLRGTSNDVEYTFHEEGLVESKAGDLLLLWDGSNAGEFIISKDGYLSSTCALLSNKFESNSYFGYLCNVSEKYLKDMTNGMGIPHVDSNVFKNLTAIIPSQSEQESIVAYLDEKCGSVDKVIAKQERRIALLKELKQSIISEAVTRGINPEAPLKATGIEWIGQIPEHWEVKKIAHIFKTIGSGTTPSTSNSEYYCEDDGMNWLQTGDLTDGEIIETTKHITDKAITDLNLKIYTKKSLVIAMYGATVGKLGILKINTAVNQACCVLSNSTEAETMYSFYSLLSAKKHLIALSVGGGQPNISQDIIKRHKTPVPPLEEQKEIVDYIETKVKPIDQMISKATREIELLREYKQSIITEAVTGKIKVC